MVISTKAQKIINLSGSAIGVALLGAFAKPCFDGALSLRDTSVEVRRLRSQVDEVLPYKQRITQLEQDNAALRKEVSVVNSLAVEMSSVKTAVSYMRDILERKFGR